MSAYRVLPDPPRKPLSWDDVRCLEGAGMHDLAEIACGYVKRAERKRQRRRRLAALSDDVIFYGWVCGLPVGLLLGWLA